MWLSKFFIFFIKAYQYLISPLLGRRCIYYPTCSTYAIECFKNFSPPRALCYSTLRVLRCHPFAAGGFDPIPENKICRSNQ